MKQQQKNSHYALSEFEAKKMLAENNIPVTREILVQTMDEALAAADKIGYPVAVKACSPELMHKNDSGCIDLNVNSSDDLAASYERIKSSVSVKLEGILIQEMVPGNRELVLGLNREPQFGPCVMLGLGGVMTEVFKDTVFRVAPLDRTEALDMIDELKSKEMLEAFRGEKPANLEAICQCLVMLGAIGLENKQVSEIDINPLKIDPEGNVKAADALVIIKGSK
jgi:succinyl-CoA synthetase beta subunit